MEQKAVISCSIYGDLSMFRLVIFLQIIHNKRPMGSRRGCNIDYLLSNLDQDQVPLWSGLAVSNGINFPDSKVHGANMGPTWVLSDPDEPHVVSMNLAIRVAQWYVEWLVSFSIV